MLCIYFLKFAMFFSSKMYTEVDKNINKKILRLLGVGVCFYYDLKYNRLILILKDVLLSRMHNMQLLCPYYVKDHIKAMLH